MLKNLYLIIGRSGTGKTTITNELEKRYELKSVESYTTRPPRYKNEKGHVFVNKEEFDKLDLVAYTYFNGNEYGITEDILNSSDLYVIDINGVKTLKQKYKKRKLVLINIKSSLTKENMLNRGDSLEDINKRLTNDDIMFKEEDTFPFDYVVYNENLESSINQIYKIIGDEENE